jgi:hypothetical protein
MKTKTDCFDGFQPEKDFNHEDESGLSTGQVTAP